MIIGFDADVDCTDVAAAAAAKGVRFIARYLKNLSLAEARAISAAGLQIVSIWETTAQRALAGAAAGDRDGAMAHDMAAALDQPQGSAICATADFDLRPGRRHADQMASVLAYFLAFKASAAPAKLMVYASGEVCQAALDRGLADYTWVCNNRWTGSPEFIHSGRATIMQDVGDYRSLDLGIDIDSDVALTDDFGGWSLAAEPVPVPTPVPVAPRSGDAEAFVRAFQADHPPLVVDGDPGRETWTELDALRHT